MHGRGVDELLEAVIAGLALPPPPTDRAEADGAGDAAGAAQGDSDADGEAFGPLRVAFVGKPNVGKSSLVNRLLGVERALVHHDPGTTTDPVDTPFEFGGQHYVLVDTAGIRRRARVDAETEKISMAMALSQIRQAHVAVLVIDAPAGASEQDARLARAIEDSGRAVVVALNKSDLLRGVGAAGEVERRTREELHFLGYAPTALISALRGDGVADLMRRIDAVAVEHRRRVPTGELNRFFEEVCQRHPPALHKGRPVRIHYLTQARTRPPTFVLWANHPEAVSPAYHRFLVNQLRQAYGFDGTPLRLQIKQKSDRRRRAGQRGARGRR
jgi:GTP-binding protein